MKSINRNILLLTIFAIAMGFLETSLVVYLRKIYYPNGFNFPLIKLDNDIFGIEIVREFATLVMMTMIGMLIGKNKAQRFAYFIYCFAIWDIFYYVFLKVLLNWPESIFTPDILFLIPVPWIGPVIAPIILSLSMIVLSLVILFKDEKHGSTNNLKIHWKLLIAGSVIIILSFTLNYFISRKGINNVSTPENLLNIQSISSYFGTVHWIVFVLGEILIVYSIYNIIKLNGEQLECKNCVE